MGSASLKCGPTSSFELSEYKERLQLQSMFCWRQCSSPQNFIYTALTNPDEALNTNRWLTARPTHFMLSVYPMTTQLSHNQMNCMHINLRHKGETTP